MKRKLFSIVLILAGFNTTLLFAQQKYCGDGRYVNHLFEVADVVTVQYGKNTTVGGKEQDLLMDVYQPKNDDASKRPVILFAFGGSFIEGDRSQVAPLCIHYAKKGYVAAAIDYRLFDGQGVPDSVGMMDVAIKAMGDIKAAIRFFRQDEATSNRFKIDPNYIMIGGFSSGSIACLHAAYMDENDNIPAFMLKIINDNGGFEGDSGDEENLKYSSRISGVINYFGGIYTKNWMNENEPPICSIHGEKDDVVAYGDGRASVKLGGLVLTSVSISGSGSIHKKANELKIPNSLIKVPNGGHGDFMADTMWIDSMYQTSALLLHDKILCPDYMGTEENTAKDFNFNVYPNPSIENITVNFNLDGNKTIRLFDQTGRLVLNKSTFDYTININALNLTRGIYILNISTIKHPEGINQKIMVN